MIQSRLLEVLNDSLDSICKKYEKDKRDPLALHYVHQRNLAMKSDPIVEEIRQYRAEHAAKYGYDLDRIFEAIKISESKSHRKTVNPGPKRLPIKKDPHTGDNSATLYCRH